MKRYYCTYFDRNYLVKALALFESLNRHERNAFEIFAVCMDEITRVILESLAIPNVIPVPMHEIEDRDLALVAAKQDRSIVEYYWTATPTIILRILEKHPHIDVLTYLDSDLYFFSSPDPIFEELGDHSVLIHEHRFPPRLAHLEQFGKYNVGLLCFRWDGGSVKVLKWWRDRCLEWCRTQVDNGRFADQGYLNDWPSRFERVTVLQNLGAGVGPWNHEQYTYALDDNGRALIDGIPVVFYHFHALVFVNPDTIIPARHPGYMLREDIIRLCFVPYLQALSRSIILVRSVVPDFAFGLFTPRSLSPSHSFVARRRLSSQLGKLEIQHIRIELDEEWDGYCSNQMQDFQRLQERYGRSPNERMAATLD